MDFLDLVEEYRDDIPLKQFDKIKVIIARAKDIDDGKPIFDSRLKGRKPTTIAHYELMQNQIQPDIFIEEKTDDDFMDLASANDDEEEEND
ncbi:MAG: DNA-directed RNA polymerase subunit omega [Deltaproteobacteria bacterium]|nr:DNA-directed RNA polymerase subunit omega [Deltaproteobacteria bacterium]